MLLHIPNFRRLYSSNACVRAIVGHLAANGTPRKVTVVAEMWKELRERAYTFPRSEVIRAFKSLQHVGAGTFIFGRNRYPTRFHHTVDAVTLANAARGEGEDAAGTDTPLAGARDAAAVIDHRYVLRPDFHITVRLPADLTKTEATRLAEFIKTLPFA